MAPEREPGGALRALVRRATSSGAWALALSLAAAGCSASRPLRPLPPGAYAAELSVPGVWMHSAHTFPVGAPALGLRRGLPGGFELALRWYPILLPARIVGLESGVVWHASAARGWVPALHLGSQLSVLGAPAHLRDGPGHALRGAMTGEVTVHWEPLPWLWPYLVQQDAVILADGTLLASLYGGVQLRLSERWDLSLETGVAGLNARTRDYTQPYQGVGGRGAIWMSWSVAYRFGPGAAARGPRGLEPQGPRVDAPGAREGEEGAR